MSLASQSVFLIPRSRILFSRTNVHLKSSSFSLSLLSTYFKNPPHFPISKTEAPSQNRFIPFRTHQWPIRVYESGRTVDQSDSINHLNFDAFLSVAEFLCLASSVVISIMFAVSSVISSSQKPFLVWLWNKGFAWQFVLLAGAVVFGASIRRRQWSRMCSDLAKRGNSGINLVGRIEKLEEDLRSSVTIIRSLSRQLEKLGIRFRVTRKALKGPIAETAALAQKNSEATRALAVQEDILEKELGEIQKVLLAMQEQQQRQLELILAVGKTGKLWETRASGEDQTATETRKAADSQVKQAGNIQLETLSGQTETKDRV